MVLESNSPWGSLSNPNIAIWYFQSAACQVLNNLNKQVLDDILKACT